MDGKRRLDNSIGVCASTRENALPDGRKWQEMADYVCNAKPIRLSVPLVPSSCLDVKLRPEGRELQEASVFYGAESHFNLVEMHRILCEILYGQDEQEKPSYFSEYSVNLDELPKRPSMEGMYDMTYSFMTPFFGKKKSVEVSAGTDIDILSEQISDIVEIHQRLGRINRYANKFKFWEEKHNENRSN